MYNITTWKDHAVDPSNTYTPKNNSDGTVTLTPAGKIIQQGTNMNAANFNNLETGTLAANIGSLEAANAVRLAMMKGIEHDEAFQELEESALPSIEKEINFVNATGLETALLAKKALEKAEALEGFVLTATLTNTQKYPFNNSTKTIALSGANIRYNKNYTVIVEVESYTGNCVGDIVVSDKLLNGFKIAFTGSAKTVNVKIYVQGGI